MVNLLKSLQQKNHRILNKKYNIYIFIALKKNKQFFFILKEKQK